MHVIYDGPIDRVDIAMPGRNNDIHAIRGVPVEVPEDVGRSLIRQSTWTKATTTKAAKAADKQED